MRIKNDYEPEVKSNFDREEEFTFDNVPKSFESVTNKALKEIRQNSIERIERITDFDPATLQVTLESNVDAQFGAAYNTLEGDYGTRRANLKQAYHDGFADLDRDFQIFKLQVADYNAAFRRYDEANKIINGEELPKNLAVSDEEMIELTQSVKQLNRRKYE